MSGSAQDRCTTLPPGPPHDDPGLQPERTTLAWGRTVLAFLTAAVCLRWAPHHGVFVLMFLAVAVSAGAAVYLTQRARYRRSSTGINTEQITADTAGVLSIAAATATVGGLGIYVVLALA